mgnify:CR=1 FL=1
MLTYVGKGYTPGFTINYDRIARRMNDGEEIELVEGPDDICQALLCEKNTHCFNTSVLQRDETARLSVSELLNETFSTGKRFHASPEFLLKLRAAFAAGELRRACHGCQWHKLCNHVAASGFHGVRIGEPAATAEITP